MAAAAQPCAEYSLARSDSCRSRFDLHRNCGEQRSRASTGTTDASEPKITSTAEACPLEALPGEMKIKNCLMKTCQMKPIGRRSIQ
eukprot:6189759-Pleurochrysis_carterae.AAC.1